MPSLDGLLSDSDEEVAPPTPTGGVQFCVLDDPLLQETVVAVAPHSAGHRAISAAAGGPELRAAQRSKRAIKAASCGGAPASAKVKAASGGGSQASTKVKAKVSKAPLFETKKCVHSRGYHRARNFARAQGWSDEKCKELAR